MLMRETMNRAALKKAASYQFDTPSPRRNLAANEPDATATLSSVNGVNLRIGGGYVIGVS
jgi:hypothetical protein